MAILHFVGVQRVTTALRRLSFSPDCGVTLEAKVVRLIVAPPAGARG